MSPIQLAAVHRRAENDAIAHRCSWPVYCPYPAQSEEAKEWRVAFEDELKVGIRKELVAKV